MTRQEITNRIGTEYHTANIEEDEYSYVKAAGSKKQLADKLGHGVGAHFKLDLVHSGHPYLLLLRYVLLLLLYLELDERLLFLLTFVTEKYIKANLSS